MTKTKILSDIKKHMKSSLRPEAKAQIKQLLSEIHEAVEQKGPANKFDKLHAKIEAILRKNCHMLQRPIALPKGLQLSKVPTPDGGIGYCQTTKACRIVGLIPLYVGYGYSIYRVKLNTKAYRDPNWGTFDYIPLNILSHDLREQIWHDLFA